MSARRATALLATLAALLLGGCGGASDAWRAGAERACRAGTARATEQARDGGRAALVRAGTALVDRADALRDLRGPRGLDALATSTEGVGRALRAYARSGAPRALRAARTLEGRQERQARALGLTACAG